ncbi:MAG: MFS transporter [Armatimonadetes bacterium]|nr:MFS transporter [Armatimonadota bacterium]
MSSESNSQPKLRPALLESMGLKVALPPILGIFLTVFLDMLSFGMFIPDLQLRVKLLAAEHYGLGIDTHDARVGALVGMSLAAFSLAQLVTAPFLGRLSDRIGRRRVLLITCLLSVASYVAYAHSTSLTMVFVSRVLGGIGAANLGVAFAYIADVTKPEDRAKGLGLVGAAFGLGFILGPFSGTQLLKFGHNEPLLLGYVAAGLSLVNLLYVWLLLPESLKESNVEKGHFLSDFKTAVASPGLGLLLAMFFALNLGFTNLETTYFQLLADSRSVFHLGETMAKEYGGYILAMIGVISAFTQGFLVRRLMPVYGEVNLIRFCLPILAVTLLSIPFTPLWIPALIGLLFFGMSNGLVQPSLSSVISRSAPAAIQGGIFGITQALGALARCVGPLIGNSLFSLQPSYPYILGASLILIPVLAAWRIRMPEPTGSAEGAVTAH